MNPIVVDRLIQSCDNRDIPYQLTAIGRATGTDANSIQISRQGVAAACVTIPNRYMHSAVETIALSDIDFAADLLADFCANVDSDDDFRPSSALI